ncbi:MAG: hypothetical protein LBC33_01440, partial [Mycoplasmataceae bacterium]|nr:hypothetical protein [Mycoplasmataceae bacterium]
MGIKLSEQIKIHSQTDHIPFVRDQTIVFIIDLIKKNHLQTICEIGTAYGYSAAKFAEISDVKKIITIEKDQK